MKGGEVEWKRNGTVVVSKGKGKRDVLTISNKHMLKFVPVSNESSEVKMKPNIVRDYNDGMSGINSSSDALLLSRFEEKCSMVQEDWVPFYHNVYAQLVLSFQESKSPE